MLGRDFISATWDLQDLKGQLSNRAREKYTLGGTKEESWRWTLGIRMWGLSVGR